MTLRLRESEDLGAAAPDVIGCTEAFDAAFTSQACRVTRPDGSTFPLSPQVWSGGATDADLTLFVDPCRGPTLDVGCGPGRLTGALHARGVRVVGIDTSAEAVRLTAARGATALRRDVFSYRTSGPRWRHILLADGNIGLGGDPVRLLRRLRGLLHDAGTMLAEVAAPGVRSGREQLRLHLGDRVSSPFPWGVVGVDDVVQVAARAGLSVNDVDEHSGRFVAALGMGGS